MAFCNVGLVLLVGYMIQLLLMTDKPLDLAVWLYANDHRVISVAVLHQILAHIFYIFLQRKYEK